jgi:hypothetical protein
MKLAEALSGDTQSRASQILGRVKEDGETLQEVEDDGETETESDIASDDGGRKSPCSQFKLSSIKEEEKPENAVAVELDKILAERRARVKTLQDKNSLLESYNLALERRVAVLESNFQLLCSTDFPKELQTAMMVLKNTMNEVGCSSCPLCGAKGSDKPQWLKHYKGKGCRAALVTKCTEKGSSPTNIVYSYVDELQETLKKKVD